MNDDLIAAAKRLKEHEQAMALKQSASSPYAYGAIVKDVQRIDWERRDGDKKTIANALLPELDDTPVTEHDGAWLVSIGGKKLRGTNCVTLGTSACVWLYDESLRQENGKDSGIRSSLECGVNIYNPTRGQVRTLCRALGVQLKESEARDG